MANEASASNHGQILAWAARLRTYLEFWSRVASLIGSPMPLARSPRATSIHASNLDVNDANKASRAAPSDDLAGACAIISDLYRGHLDFFNANEI